MISANRSFTATTATAHLPSFRSSHELKMSAPEWDAAGPISTTTAIRMSMFQACGKQPGGASLHRGNFTRKLPKTCALSTRNTRKGMLSTETRATEPLTTLVKPQVWRWDAGRGLQIFGTSTTTAMPIFTLQMDTSPGSSETIWQAFSGGKWLQNLPMMRHLQLRTSEAGMQSTNWCVQTTRGMAMRAM